MLGYVLAVLASVCLAALAFSVKRQKLDYPLLFFNHAVLSVVFLFVSFFMVSFKMPKDFTVAVILVMALFAVVALYLFYHSLRSSLFTVLAVGMSSFALLSFLVSWLAFKVKPVLFNYIGIGLLVIGVVIFMIRKFILPKKTEEFFDFLNSDAFEHGAFIAVGLGIFAALFRLSFYFTVPDIGTHRTLVYVVAVMLVFLMLPLLNASLKGLFKDKKEKMLVLGSAAAYSACGVLLFFALTKLTLDKTLLIFALPIVPALAGLFIFKERFKIHQYIGLVIFTIGFILLML